MDFDIRINHQRIQITCLHLSRCHHCPYYNIDIVLFHDVTSYINPFLSPIHVNTIKLLHITCTLVATKMILWSLECIGNLPYKNKVVEVVHSYLIIQNNYESSIKTK